MLSMVKFFYFASLSRKIKSAGEDPRALIRRGGLFTFHLRKSKKENKRQFEIQLIKV